MASVSSLHHPVLLNAYRTKLSAKLFYGTLDSSFATSELSSSSSTSWLCKLAAAQADLPPSTQKEALLQARSALAALLEKPLRSLDASKVKQRKQQRQLRLRVEIPLLEDESVHGLLIDLLSNFTVGKSANAIPIAVFCHSWLVQECRESHPSHQNPDLHFCDFQSSGVANAESAQVVVMVAPKLSDLPDMKRITSWAFPRPVVLLNPDWVNGEEKEVDEEGKALLQSFDVVYSYLPLCIQGFFSKTEGAVLKHVRNGAPAGRPWLVFVKEGGEMKCAASLKDRPDATDLEDTLYTTAAENSPITKSVKFLKGLMGGR